MIAGCRVATGPESLRLGEDDLLVLLVGSHGASRLCDLLKCLVETAVRNSREAHRVDFDGRHLEPGGSGVREVGDDPQIPFRWEGRVQGHVHHGLGVHISHLRLEALAGVHGPSGLVEGHVDDRGGATG